MKMAPRVDASLHDAFDLERALIAARAVPSALAHRHLVLPIEHYEDAGHAVIHVGMHDPDNARVLTVLEEATGCRVEACPMGVEEILERLSLIYPVPPIDMEHAQQAARFLRSHVAKMHDAVPRRIIAGTILEVGLANPHDTATCTALHAATSCQIHAVKMPVPEIVAALQELYPTEDVPHIRSAAAYELRFYQAVHDVFRRRGQDVVFTHKGDVGKIIAVLDGHPLVIETLPLADLRHIVRAGLVAAKVRGSDDLYQTHRGRIETTIDGTRCVLRLVCLPTHDGHAMLSVRLTSAHDQFRTLADMRMPTAIRERFLRILQAFTGLILAAGPPSHGKSTLMNAALYMYYLRTLSEMLHSIECPVETTQPWVTSHSVGEGELTYESAISHLLSVPVQGAMFGDLLDAYTIGQALRLAHTGVPVFGTTHGQSGPGTIWRLLSEGIDASELTVLRAIVGMRLIPVLCDQCSRPAPDAEAQIWLEAARAYGGQLQALAATPNIREPGTEPCDKCIAGYFGRQPIFELFEITTAGKAAIARRESADVLAATDPQYQPLWIPAAEMVLSGRTSPAKAGMWAAPPDSLFIRSADL